MRLMFRRLLIAMLSITPPLVAEPKLIDTPACQGLEFLLSRLMSGEVQYRAEFLGDGSSGNVFRYTARDGAVLILKSYDDKAVFENDVKDLRFLKTVVESLPSDQTFVIPEIIALPQSLAKSSDHGDGSGFPDRRNFSVPKVNMILQTHTMAMMDVRGRTLREILLAPDVGRAKKNQLRAKFHVHKKVLLSELLRRDELRGYVQRYKVFDVFDYKKFFQGDGRDDGLPIIHLTFKSPASKAMLKSDNIIVEDETERFVLIDPW